jgi:hypothetical protein
MIGYTLIRVKPQAPRERIVAGYTLQVAGSELIRTGERLREKG